MRFTILALTLGVLLGQVLLGGFMLMARRRVRDAGGRLPQREAGMREILVAADGVVAIDEAQLAAARDAALEASRVKTDFLAVMSHELRTPLNGVIGMTSLLLGTALSERQRDYAETVRTSADRLLELLNDALDLSKVNEDRLELEILDFDLDQLLREVVQMLEVGAGQKGVALTAAIDDNVLLALRGDPARVRQVLLNLVGNAVKFTSTGSVHVRVLDDTAPAPAVAAAGQRRLRFEITDTGIGIASEARGRLFESFSQADSSTTRRHGGTGLGLAISKSLVTLFDGQIGVESQLGVGSTFWFTARFFPGTPFVTSSRVEAPAAAVQFDAPPGLVLVVDDVAVNQKVAVGMLESLGHRADAAANGAEAVEAWARVPYDLILMDCRMPVMDGYEATRAIRAAEAGRHTPIVAMTASAMAGDRQRCRDVGMDDLLSKPVHLADVRAMVDRWLRPSSAAIETMEEARALVHYEATGPPILDGAIVSELRCLGQDFLGSLAQVFMASVPGRMANIRAAVQSADIEQLSISAHALRGSAANIGGARVTAVCARLEEAGNVGHLAEAESDLVLLEAETDCLLEALGQIEGCNVTGTAVER